MKIATVVFKSDRKDIVTHTKAKMTDDQLVQRCIDVWGHLGDMTVTVETV